MRLKVGEGLAGMVAETGKPVLVPDANKEPHFDQRVDSQTGFSTHSLITLPLTLGEKVIGVLQIINPENQELFTDRFFPILQILSDFDGAYFRLNKIENYNPDSPVTKCEFLKLKEANDFTPLTAVAIGAVAKLGTKPMPKFRSGNDVLKAGNSYASLEQCIKGQNNYISRNATGINITGDSNKVFSDTNNVIIQGDNNIVNSGLSNVMLINTNDITVNSSNVTYINGTIIGNGSVVTTSTSITADKGVTTYEGDTSAASVNITLPNDAIVGKVWNFKKIDALNTLQIRTTGGKTIDGSATLNIVALYTTYSIQFDGNNFIII